MGFTQVTLTGIAEVSPGTPANGAVVTAMLSAPITDGVTVIAPAPVRATCGSDGSFSLTVPANDDPTTEPTGTSYHVQISYGTLMLDELTVTVPHADAPSVELFSLTAPGTGAAVSYVSRLIAGSGITLAPSAGTGVVEVSSTGGGGGASIDTNASDIQPLGVQAAGSTGKAADAGHVHAMPTAAQVGADASGAAAAEQTRAEAAEALLIPLSQKAAANGVATLDGTGNVPSNQLANATGGGGGIAAGYSSTGADGYLASPPAFRWRGAWAPSTAYNRSDIVIDPYGALRWCGIAHTSGAAWDTGTEYQNTGHPQWQLIATVGAWRGKFTPSHNASYGIQFAINDVVIDPTTGDFLRAVYENSNGGGTFSESNFSDFGPISPFTTLDPGIVLPVSGMPSAHSAVQRLGLYPRTVRIQYPRVKPLLRLNTSASFTSVTGGSVTADPDPIDPAGCPTIPIGATATVNLTGTVDLSSAIIRFPAKLTGGPVQKQVGVLGAALSTSLAITSLPLDSTGCWYGVAPHMTVIVNDGAGHTQTFTIADWVTANAGASVSQLPVSSQTPSFAFPVGSTISTIGPFTTSIYLEVSSDNFATTASQATIYQTTGGLNKMAEEAWAWYGTGPGGWSTVGGFANPANLAAVNSIRWVTSGSTNLLSLSRVDVLPNNGATGSKGDGRAKCVLSADGSYIGHWTYLLNTFLEYGFPLTEVAQGAIDNTGVTTGTYHFEHVHYMSEFHACQMGVHYYYPNDGGDDQLKDGPAKATYIQRGRHSLKSAGALGTECFAWHDDDHPSWMNLPIVRAHAAYVRGYAAADTLLQTLPPVDPWYIHAYGVGTADVTGYSVGATSTDMPSGTSVSSIALSGTLSRDVALGEQLTLGSQTVTVATYTAAGATSIPIASYTPTADIPVATSVLNPGSAMKDFVDQAIAHAGLCVFAWENTSATRIEAINICAYLDAKRASIDTVTLAEALQPWMVPSA